ncbi:MAG: diguanylate cyclase [Candidatus Firestonebacteria bacterium]|nr:diguanylate cyclase [Candidatus Firestonebacteria bacterium]
MSKNISNEIFKLCYSIDRIASRLYANYASSVKNGKLKSFWKEMAEEEKEHVKFWVELKELSKKDLIPQIFDEPKEIKKALKDIECKGIDLLKESKKLRRKSDMFLSALNLEFMLLHPSFFTIFNFIKNTNKGNTPEETYDNHLDKFLKALINYRKEISELSFVGELLDNLLKENKKLEVQGQIDIITKIQNRRGFYTAVNPLAHLAKRNNYNIGIMMLDIDNFKDINDKYGHKAGDEVLISVAKIVKNNIRISDVVGRFGGDEFIVFFSKINSEAVYDLCEKIRLKIEKEMAKNIPVTVSIGICHKIITGKPEEEVEFVTKKADKCLYKAKKFGKNRVVSCD